MTGRKVLGAFIAGLVASGATATVAFAYKGEKLAPQATISLDRAREIALRTSPGQVVDEELEREKGGSGLRYSFDIKNGAVTHEIGVDAKTGQVLENKVERGRRD